MGIKDFFKKAFDDIKNDAKAQHEVDKAEFEAVRAESKAKFNRIKNSHSVKAQKESKRLMREEKINKAKIRKENAEKHR